MIVLVADHGEEHYDHRGFWHGHTLYDELLHVPLIIRGPGIPAAFRVPTPVEVMGTFPSLEELVHLPTAEGSAPRQARSFAPLLGGAALDEKSAFAERVLYGEPRRSIRLGGFKLIEWLISNHLELYDVSADPAERRNLAWERPERVDRLREAMNAIDRENERLRAPPLPAKETARVERETLERLRSLGYLH